jgi:hypothetical protein
MRAYALQLVCGVAQASVGGSLSRSPARGRYNRAGPGGRQLRSHL